MSQKKLQNYLRTYRKKAGLSQDEMAFLLGCEDGAKVSRYERFARRPNIETAFAYEMVFRISAQKLFGGVFQKVHQKTIKRAQLLAQKLKRMQSDNLSTQKLAFLTAIYSA